MRRRLHRSKSYQCWVDQTTGVVLLSLARVFARQTKRRWFSPRCAYLYFLRPSTHTLEKLFDLNPRSPSSVAINGRTPLLTFVSLLTYMTTHMPACFLRMTLLPLFTTSTKTGLLEHFSGELEMDSRHPYGQDRRLLAWYQTRRPNSSRVKNQRWERSRAHLPASARCRK